MSNKVKTDVFAAAEGRIVDQEAVLAAEGRDIAKRFNRKYKTLQKQETALINLVREVVALDSRSAMKEFKKNVNADRSTVNRYIKIAECQFINDNVEQLPIAVSVLLKIAQQIENFDFQEMLDAGELSPDTTLRNIKEWLEASADDGMKESEEPSEPTEVTEVETPEECQFVMTCDLRSFKSHHVDELISELADLSCESPVAKVVYDELLRIYEAFGDRNEAVQLANAA